MVIDRQTFDALVEQVYRASTSEISWESALRSVASAFDASLAAVVLERCELSQIRLDPADIKPEPVAVHLSADLGDFPDLYFSHYHQLDPFRLSLPIAFSPSIMRLQEVCDPKDFARSEYYQDFAIRADSFHLSRFTSRFDAKLQLKVMLNRSEKGVPLDDLELARFDSLTTHIMRALKVERQITQMGATMDAAFDALNQIGRAAFLVDRNGRVVRMNALADSICGLDDGLTVRNNRLVVDAQNSQRQLREALARQICEDAGAAPAGPAIVAFTRPSGGRPYMAEITPFEFESYWTTETTATALVTINDPDAQQRPKSTGDWGKALGLTRGEWRVATTLVSSRDEGEVAATLGISLNTVKTHRKRIYAKLGIHRRAELTAILPGLR
ncbi:helix-turn-helix transcriptional regulator [Pelagibius litoralis]|uniref:Helix-turn-helix transcriptional regulator n=1 Tax=Pelagibius litoralis TaxID=374515 RepID=A0A967CBA7_9PROT|nr:helix-turn-helix transcriptional regulator [Pelagibius litoralis]NIA68054.1 helix-turn-helix transcriptional regulator [Pelagibius litoralis]